MKDKKNIDAPITLYCFIIYILLIYKYLSLILQESISTIIANSIIFHKH